MLLKLFDFLKILGCCPNFYNQKTVCSEINIYILFVVDGKLSAHSVKYFIRP